MSEKVNFGTARPSALSPPIATMRPPPLNKNKELEKVRQDVLLEAAGCQDSNWHQEDSELARQLRRLHASWLCYQQGNECLKTLCHFMTSVPTSLAGNWQALAGALGLTNNQIMSITNKQSCVRIDSAQLVIWTYSQNANSNLYQIIKSLQTLKRYDALQQLKEPIQQLVDGVKLLVESDKAKFIYENINQAEAGADCQSADTVANLIAPKNYQKDIRLMLPMSLQNLVPVRNTEIVVQVKNDDISTPRPIIQQEVLVSRQTTAVETMPPQPTTPNGPKLPKVNVFLTFAADGEAAARRIARQMRTAFGDRPEFGVLILDENAEKVLNNPEILINQLFPQFNFICPILTVGYLQAINAPLIECADQYAQYEMRSAMDSLDACYVKFIHNLMLNEYTTNNCRNQRFRCIVPKVDVTQPNTTQQKEIFAAMRKPGYLNPTLRTWVYERDLENFLRRLIGLY